MARRRDDEGRALRLLSLDAGGPRAASQLAILKRLEHAFNENALYPSRAKPRDIFDMIEGVGTGGFIAILLVIFGLNAEETMDELARLSIAILQADARTPARRTQDLRIFIDDLTARHNIPRTRRMMDQDEQSGQCLLAIPIAYKHHAHATCTARNFASPRDLTPNLTVAEALLATLTTPPLFFPTSIEDSITTIEYVGGELATSNPASDLITEAHSAFGPERKVACFVSLGCGRPGPAEIPDGSNLKAWMQFYERLVGNSEREAQRFATHVGQTGIYHRFTVQLGLEITIQRDKPKADASTGIASLLGTTVARQVESATDWAQGYRALTPEEIMGNTEHYLRDRDVTRELESCADSLQEGTGISTLEQLKHAGGMVIPLSPPLLVRGFVMRQQPWDFMVQCIVEEPDMMRGPQRLLVVTGIPGCGKSEIVLKFIEIYGERYASSFFVDGSSEKHIRSDIMRHVRSLGPEHTQKSFSDCLDYLAQPIESGLKRLLIYDNVDDRRLNLSRMMPQGNCCVVLVTSRNHSLGELCPSSHLVLDVMSEEESIELLLGHLDSPTPQARAEAATIASELGYLPLALRQAQGYIWQTGCTRTSYLRTLRGSWDRLLARPIDQHRDQRYNSTLAAFNASWEELPAMHRQILHLFSKFHWRRFPLELLKVAAQQKFNHLDRFAEYQIDDVISQTLLYSLFCPRGEWDSIDFDEALIVLRNYSLVTITPGVETALLDMHPLLHQWVRSSIVKDEEKPLQSAAILLLACGPHLQFSSPTQYLLNHLLHLSSLWQSLNANDAVAFGIILQHAGLYDSAVVMREMVLDQMQVAIAMGAEPEGITLAMEHLASSYTSLGRFLEARDLREAIVRKRKEVYGEDHVLTVQAYSNLVTAYRDLRRWSDAERLQESVTQFNVRTFGEEAPATLSAYLQLADIQCKLKRPNDAERLQLKVLRIIMASPARHSGLSLDEVMASLANTYIAQDRFAEAHNILQELCVKYKEMYDEKSPQYLNVAHDLGTTLDQMGQTRPAEELYSHVLHLKLGLLGPNNLNTILTSSALAEIYTRQERYREAEALQLDVLSVRRAILGDQHLDTIEAKYALAGVYEKLGETKQAKQLRQSYSKSVLGIMLSGDDDDELMRLNPTVGRLAPASRAVMGWVGTMFPGLATRARAAMVVSGCPTEQDISDAAERWLRPAGRGSSQGDA